MNADLQSFMETLFEDKPSELYILIWTLQDKESHWFMRPAEAIGFIESESRCDLYVGVGLAARSMGPHQRCKAGDVAGIVGLWADIDLRSDAHPNPALPGSAEEGRRILPERLPPTLIVETGNGLHAWWKFKEPWIFEDEEDRTQAVALSERWQTLLKRNASAKGFAFDRLADLARVLRIPGTTNFKDPAHPKPVRIVELMGRQYDPSDIEDLLDYFGIKQESAWTAASDDFDPDFDVTLDPNAAIPHEILESLRAHDLKFQNTWDRKRHDLKDQSQSGYDLALANFGVRAKLPDQLIVDLIIQHRRNHAQRPLKAVQYFKRTIAKARKAHRNEQDAYFASNTWSRGSENADPEAAAIRRATLCTEISERVGVEILHVLKVKGKDPVYQLDLADRRVEFESLSKLINQQIFRTTIGAAINRLPNKQPGKGWETVTQSLVAAVTELDGGDEADFVGRIRMMVDRYLEENGPAELGSDLHGHSARKPILVDGQIAICSDDLRAHIYKTQGESIQPVSLASMLTALGAQPKRFKRGTMRDQSRWLLPMGEFAAESYMEAAEGPYGSSL